MTYAERLLELKNLILTDFFLYIKVCIANLRENTVKISELRT